jgi:nitroreductase
MKDMLERRSIRKYTDEPISDADLKNLLKAAMAAPSACNEQPWEFVVIKDKNILKTMIEFHPSGGYNMLGHAPLAIVVCGTLKRQLCEGCWMLDCAAATENILIAAQSIGLGAVWLGVYPREDRIFKVSNILHLPEGVIPFSIVSLGHPAESKKPSNRYNSARVHINCW